MENKTMETYIAKAMTIAIKHNVEGISPSTMANRLDYEILDYLIAFIKENKDSFHSFDNSIELEDLEHGHWGYFSNSIGTVVVNEALVKGLSKKLVLGIGDKYLRVLVDTVLHEHRHCYQRRHKLPMIYVPYTSYKDDFQAYHNHPMEVDAREYASNYVDAALEYIYGKLVKKYVNPVRSKLREESTL